MGDDNTVLARANMIEHLRSVDVSNNEARYYTWYVDAKARTRLENFRVGRVKAPALLPVAFSPPPPPVSPVIRHATTQFSFVSETGGERENGGGKIKRGRKGADGEKKKEVGKDGGKSASR